MNKYRMHFIIIVALLSLLCAHTSFAAATDKVELKVVYMPETNYRMTTLSAHNVTGKLRNPSLATEAQRKKLPMSMQQKDDQIISILTGSAANNKFPISFEIIKNDRVARVNDGFPQKIKSGSELIGLRAHGTCNHDGNVKFSDFEFGKEIPEEQKKLIAAMFTELEKSLTKLQTKPIGVGESFIEKGPINIPIPGIATLGMEVTTTYKLINIKNGIAYFNSIFDLKLSATAEADKSFKIKASGKGSGKIHYDFKKRVILKQVTNMKWKAEIPVEGTLAISSESTQTTTTEIL